MRGIIFAFMMVLMASFAMAVEPNEVLNDPVLEARARDLSAELRCVVCQSESIEASSAEVARDLRILVREKLVEGLTDEEIKDYLAARYGDFILLKPRMGGSTLLLWLVGPLMLLLGGVVVAMFIRKSGQVPLDDEDL